MMVSKQVDTASLVELPIYFTHAQNDTTCNVNSSKAMYEALNNLGAKNNHLTIWSNQEMTDEGIAEGLLHWSWVKVLNHNEEGSPMNWLFKQTNASENIPVEKEESNNSKTETTASEETKKAVKTGDDSTVELMAMMTGLSLLAGTSGPPARPPSGAMGSRDMWRPCGFSAARTLDKRRSLTDNMPIPHWVSGRCRHETMYGCGQPAPAAEEDHRPGAGH